LTSGGGNFTLTLSPAGINDLVGNAMTTGAYRWFRDRHDAACRQHQPRFQPGQ